MAGKTLGDRASENVRVITKKSIGKEVGKAPDAIGDAFLDMIEKIQNMTLEKVMADNGLNFEKDQSRKKEGVWTLRITKGWRALCLLRTGPIIEIFGIKDPTSAHSSRRR